MLVHQVLMDSVVVMQVVDRIMEVLVLVDKDLAVLEEEMLVDKDRAASLVEMLVVKDLAASVGEMLVDKDLIVSSVETLAVKDLAVLVVEMLVDKDLAVSLVVMLGDKVPVVLETVLDLESPQLIMVTMVHTKVVIYLLFLANQEQTTQYYLKYQTLRLLVIKDYQDTTLILKLGVKYSIFVLIILNMTSYVQMEQSSINSILYVSGGISLIAQQLKVFMV